MSVYVALLRGVNMAGRNKLRMQDLAGLFTDLGCRNVHTYIQSGNVVFNAPKRVVARVPRAAAAAISQGFGLDVPVVIRSRGEFREVVARNPFLAAATETKPLYVAFLADAPAAAKVTALDPERSPGDDFAVRGQDIYLHCPNGMARSKLTTAYFDARLATTTTVRNWNTVTKMLDLANSLSR